MTVLYKFFILCITVFAFLTPSDLVAQSDSSESFDIEDFPDCPSGYVLMRIVTTGVTQYICISLSIKFPVPGIYIPISDFYIPLPLGTYYRAGICPTNLSGIPIRLGPIRHDDIQSFSLDGLGRFDESTSGFYAINIDTAIDNAGTYILSLANPLTPITISYTPGEIIHSSTSTFNCRPPIVSKKEYERFKTNAKTVRWKHYHLFLRNCQHWADHIEQLSTL